MVDAVIGHEFARLVRRMPPSFFPSADTVSVLDEARNVLFIHEKLFSTLSAFQQRRVLFSKQVLFTLDEVPRDLSHQLSALVIPLR